MSTSSTRVVEKFVVCGRHLRKTFRRCLRLSDGSDFLISSHSHVTPRPFPYLSPFIGHRSPSLWISRYLSILDFCPNHSGISISSDTELRSQLLGRFSCYHWAYIRPYPDPLTRFTLDNGLLFYIYIFYLSCLTSI